MFITFEGCEASGKSTQSRILAKKLEERGYQVMITKEPGGTKLADQMREILLEHEIEDPLTEFLLLSAARRDHFLAIEKNLLSDKIVVSDRFADSSLVYQGYVKGLNPDIISKITSYVTTGVEPDLTFLLDIDLNVIKPRIQGSKKHGNFYDLKDIKFHSKIKEGFLTLARMRKDRIIIVDANQVVEEVASIVEKVTLRYLKEFKND